MGDSPAAVYAVDMIITDLVSGQVTTQKRQFIIVETEED